MQVSSSIPPASAVRAALRRHLRAVVREPASVAAHLARLSASLELPGAEPAQGALADMFCSLGASEALVKQAAVQMAAQRLAPHVRRSFEAQGAASALPRVTPLATRWSVVAIPSADVSTRVRRASADDSRALAADVARALSAGYTVAQEEFLMHCVTCQDTLAFMLARRQAHKAGIALTPNCEAAGAELEKAVVNP